MSMDWRRWIGMLLFGLSTAAATAGALVPSVPRIPRPVESSLQCGHWCIQRCCELLGIPTDISAIQDMLPFEPDGHSVAQLADALQRLGVNSEARLDS